MRSPSLRELPHHLGTAVILFASVALTLAAWTGKDVDALCMSPMVFEGEPWRLVTSRFLHGDLLHLGFDALWMWVFGTYIERHLGTPTLAVTFSWRPRVNLHDRTASSHCDLGHRALVEHEDALARRLLERAARCPDTSADCWQNIGIARRRTGDARGGGEADEHARSLGRP